MLSYPAHRGCHCLKQFQYFDIFCMPIGLAQLVIVKEAVISFSSTFVSKSMLSYSFYFLDWTVNRLSKFMFVEANQGTCYDKKNFLFACVRKK